MKVSMSRDQLLKPLQQVSGVVEKRQTLQVLSNVLLVVDGGELSMTGTDLEVELLARHSLENESRDGKITVPCRKLLDICRALPASAQVALSVDGNRLLLKSGKSRFTLTTLPANDFPNLDESLNAAYTVTLTQRVLKQLIDKTSFAMAQQDVRYYLNGMLFEVTADRLRVVATDGHRLAMCDAEITSQVTEKAQVIVPRKGVQELSRLLADDDTEVTLTLGSNHLRVTVDNVT
ncbi:MAG: DNA polymerase III subunit beta, partial [Paraperlucidibaca sp.]